MRWTAGTEWNVTGRKKTASFKNVKKLCVWIRWNSRGVGCSSGRRIKSGHPIGWDWVWVSWVRIWDWVKNVNGSCMWVYWCAKRGETQGLGVGEVAGSVVGRVMCVTKIYIMLRKHACKYTNWNGAVKILMMCPGKGHAAMNSLGRWIGQLCKF